MMGSADRTPPMTGRFSPLRYPGGKGKLSRCISKIIQENGLTDGRYVEPFAGGAAIAWELLLTGIVRRVSVNDISRPVFSFWNSVLSSTERLCQRVYDCSISIEEWKKQKNIFRNEAGADELDLGFAFFYLNRTNRSGILNGGVIGGLSQGGPWKIDARFNKNELIKKIENIAMLRSRIKLSCMDAIDFLSCNFSKFESKTFIYIDPPYFEKGRYLYYDAYSHADHKKVAAFLSKKADYNWVISYDDVRQINDIYKYLRSIKYSINYSARNVVRGREVMFFSDSLVIPEFTPKLT